MSNKNYTFDLNCLRDILPVHKKKFINQYNLKKKIPVSDKNYFINKKKITYTNVKAISLFSGAGGLDIGSHLAGVDVISCLDFDKDSVATLQSNKILSKGNIYCDDIRTFNIKDYNQLIKKNKSDKLILLGGPPCQPFSKAGYWVTHEKRLGIKDPRNMINEYLEVINQLQPDGFILENVESLLHPKNKRMVDEIEEFIYKNNYKYIRYNADASHFGVPQKRKRVFFIVSKKNIKGEPIATNQKNNKSIERVIDWIYKFDCKSYEEPNEKINGKTYEDELRQIPPGKNYFALTTRDGHPNPKFEANKRFWSFLLKLDPFLPSWTIPAQPGPWVGPLHWGNRRLRVPEIAAIQTFPQDYVFSGSRRSIQNQIGNAVPPLLGKAIIQFLIKNI